MMIFIIRDNVSEQNSPLFIERKIDGAKRQFAMFLQGIQVSETDYDLYQVGVLDPLTMCITAEPTPIHVCNGVAVTNIPIKVVSDVT